LSINFLQIAIQSLSYADFLSWGFDSRANLIYFFWISRLNLCAMFFIFLYQYLLTKIMVYFRLNNKFKNFFQVSTLLSFLPMFAE